MDIEFKQVLTLLETLNKKKDNKTIISCTDFQKELNNIQDLYSLDQDTINSLDSLKEIDRLSINVIMEYICYLNNNLNTYIWHVESICNIIEKFIYYERFKI